MAKIYGNPLFLSGGGGQNLTLPPMVTNLAAVAGNQQITVTYKNPVSDALAGVLVVYKTGSYPTKPTDGKKVDAGLSESAVLEGLENGTDYYIRVYPYNSKKQYQTIIDGATVTARPSEGPKQVTDLQVTGSGASPVLTWKNPTDDPTYHETVVIQKVDSVPTSLSDGTEIYRGTGETVSANGLEQLVNYYFGVFTVNTEGGTRGPVVSDVYRYDFPSEPTEWSEVTRINNSTEYTFPEAGWFKVVAVAGGGNGGKPYWGAPGASYIGAGGGSGGTGGISVSQVKVEDVQAKLSITINSEDVNVTFSDIIMSCTAGTDGTNASDNAAGKGGKKGVATGGNIANQDGYDGNDGEVFWDGMTPGEVSAAGGSPAQENIYETYKSVSGQGGGVRSYADDGKRTDGSDAFVVILRGNTNTPSPSQASTLSLLPTDSTLTVDWTNSGDPVQTGTMLVYNTNHTPTTTSDGVSVDIPVAQTTVSTFAVDGEEQQTDNKKQSYTITGLTNDKPVYVALFPYDANKKYGIPKTDVEIPRVHSWYDTQQELEQEVQEAELQVEDAKARAQAATEQAAQSQAVVLMTCNYLSDAVALTMPSIYPEWDSNSVSYIGKDKATESSPANIVQYQDHLYRCLQSHTSQADWDPAAAVSLWVEIADPAEEWPEWKQPTGAHDAYAQGAKVSHNGKKWASNVENNVWEPGVYGWTEVIE